MDIEKLMNILEQVLGLGDKLDSAGGGIAGATGGSKITREVCRLQLMQFLFYLAYTNGSLTNGQVSLLNLVLQPSRSMSEWEYCKICQSQDDPTPETNLTLKAFIQGDKALSAQNGEPSTQLTDILISTFEAFGTLIITLDDNAFAKIRCSNYIEGMRNIVSKELSGNTGTGNTSAGSRVSGGFEIEDGVLTKYTGSDAHVTIPSGIKRIDDNAFFKNTNVRSILDEDSDLSWLIEKVGELRSMDEIESITVSSCLSDHYGHERNRAYTYYRKQDITVIADDESDSDDEEDEFDYGEGPKPGGSLSFGIKGRTEKGDLRIGFHNSRALFSKHDAN